MFDKMKKVMSKSEFKKLSFSEKLISNFVVNRSGGWKLFKEKSDSLDSLKEKIAKRQIKITKVLKEIETDLATPRNYEVTEEERIESNKNKTQFLAEDLRKILLYLDKEKHLSDDQLFDIFEKKNITLDPNTNADKLTDQAFKILVQELYDLRDKK